ncbi:hypothetical protein B0J11DRAFT_518765 [Dendryphion nanum]|uniref:Zn(2)-C6 fungal-type domain-containing protein n=1 Tax=Dendryphion nanum TaxID=256645 RepID=A0A9P9EAD6_9PLEO|nr:hypothetical protein B0J11DRAFT_518765 [Dendryphion nanum]
MTDPILPQSRRRACGECVKAKRKCGNEMPKCRRCSKKGIPCVYPTAHHEDINSISIPELEFPWLDAILEDPSLWSGTLQPQLAAATSSSFSPGTNISNDDTFPNPNTVPIPSYLAPSALSHTLAKNTLSQPITNAALQSFKNWPEKWLRTGKAPFIHPHLYSPTPSLTPSIHHALQSAYATCAIYATRTPSNSHLAFTLIETKASELLHSPSPATQTPLDLLANIQSLLIFQFVRLFDGDIRQRALAESAAPVLSSWTEQLIVVTEVERSITTLNAPNWRTWIFAESVRRTVTMSYVLSGVYAFVKNGFCTLGDLVTAQCFTAQGRLWEAGTEREWERAREEWDAFWVERMEFARVVGEGRPEMLDDFGMMMGIMCLGVERVEEWVKEWSGSEGGKSDRIGGVMSGDLRLSLLDVVGGGEGAS